MVRVKHRLPTVKIIDTEPRIQYSPNYDIVSKAKSQYHTSLLPTLGQPVDTANTGNITPAQVSASYVCSNFYRKRCRQVLLYSHPLYHHVLTANQRCTPYS